MYNLSQRSEFSLIQIGMQNTNQKSVCSRNRWLRQKVGLGYPDLAMHHEGRQPAATTQNVRLPSMKCTQQGQNSTPNVQTLKGISFHVSSIFETSVVVGQPLLVCITRVASNWPYANTASPRT